MPKEKEKQQNKSRRRFAILMLIITFLEFIGTVVNTIADYPDNLFNNLALSFQCVLMMILIFLPIFVKKLFYVQIPSIIYVLFTVLCFCGLVLGDVANLYDKFAHWDDLLHFGSGMLLAAIGFVFVNTFVSSENSKNKLSPVLIAVVGFCFAMTGQALWEICEYICDDIFHTNAQTYMIETTGTFGQGTPLEGHEALKDTMTDFMLDAIGGLIISVVGYFDIKRGKKNIFAGRFEPTENAGKKRSKRRKKKGLADSVETSNKSEELMQDQKPDADANNQTEENNINEEQKSEDKK